METLNDQQCLLSCLYDYTSPLAAQEKNTFLEYILEYKEYNIFPSLNIFFLNEFTWPHIGFSIIVLRMCM